LLPTIGTTYGGKWDGWYGPSGRENETGNKDPNQDQEKGPLISNVSDSMAGKALQGIYDKVLRNVAQLKVLQKEASIDCQISRTSSTCDLNGGDTCLFNIRLDPCEQANVAAEEPEALTLLLEKLEEYRKGAVPPINEPKDPRGQPKFWNYEWTNWMDFIEPDVASTKC
jgi:arylsulfatase B